MIKIYQFRSLKFSSHHLTPEIQMVLALVCSTLWWVSVQPFRQEAFLFLSFFVWRKVSSYLHIICLSHHQICSLAVTHSSFSLSHTKSMNVSPFTTLLTFYMSCFPIQNILLLSFLRKHILIVVVMLHYKTKQNLCI